MTRNELLLIFTKNTPYTPNTFTSEWVKIKFFIIYMIIFGYLLSLSGNISSSCATQGFVCFGVPNLSGIQLSS